MLPGSERARSFFRDSRTAAPAYFRVGRSPGPGSGARRMGLLAAPAGRRPSDAEGIHRMGSTLAGSRPARSDRSGMAQPLVFAIIAAVERMLNSQYTATTGRSWLGTTGAAAIVVIWIALIAATWEPLEPEPRAEPSELVDDADTPQRSREERRNQRDEDAREERPPRRDRDREQEAAPVTATPAL